VRSTNGGKPYSEGHVPAVQAVAGLAHPKASLVDGDHWSRDRRHYGALLHGAGRSRQAKDFRTAFGPEGVDPYRAVAHDHRRLGPTGVLPELHDDGSDRDDPTPVGRVDEAEVIVWLAVLLGVPSAIDRRGEQSKRMSGRHGEGALGPQEVASAWDRVADTFSSQFPKVARLDEPGQGRRARL
jgi:hypothetical protein